MRADDARKTKQQRNQTRRVIDVTEGLSQVNWDAAGIDVGSAEHYVAVPVGRDAQPVQRFGSFTADLYRLVKWLLDCGIKSVVMQATGVYWIGLYQILEEHGLEVMVTNARYTKMLPGRKSDVQECQWLQKLHTFGLLTRSFRPTEEIRVLRSYMRQRENLVAAIGICIQHMQKALTEMNLQLSNVLSDISGKSGMAILRAIVAGERDPYQLADLCDQRVKATRKEVAQSLEGQWRAELLFVVAQNLHLYDIYHEQVAECDRKIQAHLQTIEHKIDIAIAPLAPPRRSGMQPNRKHIPQFQVRPLLYQITGVDLTQVDGIGIQTAEVVLSEVGTDMSKWKTEKHFASWLGLSPDNQITGGKVIKRGTKKVVNRAATALRLAAQTLLRSQSALGAKFRRLRTRLGAPKAITAMANHLAKLIYRMLRFGHEYVDKGMEFYEKKYRDQYLGYLKKQAAKQGFQLVPLQQVVG
ncbi:MAG: IS110 family transposase [Candidatus Sulfotelmatobacter sp.]